MGHIEMGQQGYTRWLFAVLALAVACVQGFRFGNDGGVSRRSHLAPLFGAGSKSRDVWRQSIPSAPAQAATPTLTDLDALEQAQTQAKGSGLEAYLAEASRLIGKSSADDIKKLVLRLSMPALDVALPSDFEDLASTALDLSWKASGGDWEKMLQQLNTDLGKGVQRADEALKEVVDALSTCSESDLKALIVKHSPEGVNSLPKLDRTKYTGKYTASDYLAELIDVVRIQCGNDYVKVAAVLTKERRQKKGFAA